MTDNIKKFFSKDDQELIKDLEHRYSAPGVAQQVFDQIKKAEALNQKTNEKIDFMSVKAISEAGEVYRKEAQELLKRLKTMKRYSRKAANDVVKWEDKALEKEFKKFFNFFLRCNKAYWILYRQGMQTYKTGTYVPYEPKKVSLLDQAWQNTVMAVAA